MPGFCGIMYALKPIAYQEGGAESMEWWKQTLSSFLTMHICSDLAKALFLDSQLAVAFLNYFMNVSNSTVILSGISNSFPKMSSWIWTERLERTKSNNPVQSLRKITVPLFRLHRRRALQGNPCYTLRWNCCTLKNPNTSQCPERIIYRRLLVAPWPVNAKST